MMFHFVLTTLLIIEAISVTMSSPDAAAAATTAEEDKTKHSRWQST